MATEIMVQVALLILSLLIIYYIYHFSKQNLPKLPTQTRTTFQIDRHLAEATRLLNRAKSTPDKSKSQTAAKHALTEAQMAISLNPRDPKPHILKANILEFMGHQRSALSLLDSALRQPRVKALAARERGELLVKRAELKLSVNKRRRVDSAVEDLKEAVKLSEGGCDYKIYYLLSECYEFKGLREEAKKWAIKEALKVGPDPGPVRIRPS
ncbi:uncharacterized protein LOC116146366 [Pistacia vera]|uniref:uncharacterized protein LOC116146366 n=1 Tax=Pistacia vera TaxID=55513 RepID=UPI001263D9CB|nr:uncharacterized protein LOC116146366 [Pistacia vera]